MALRIPKHHTAGMFKSGTKNIENDRAFSAVQKNIEACKEISNITRTSFGPNGMNRMVINHLEQLFVTNDAATMLKELDVEHPAAKMLVLNTRMMEQEVGDGTNLVMVLAGELLNKAASLLEIGLHPSEIVSGYNKASKKAEELLAGLVSGQVGDMRNQKDVENALRPVLSSKQYGYEDVFTSVAAEACLMVASKDGKSFNMDNIRIVKVLGAGVLDSRVFRGMVFPRKAEGNVTEVTNAKVAVFNCPIDFAQTETKGAVLLKNAQDLLNFSTGEEQVIEEQIKAIADTGVKLVIAGGKVADMSLHFFNKYKIMVVRLMSKFDIRRLSKSLGATPLPRVGAPLPEECGFCSKAKMTDIGGSRLVIFEQEENASIATIVVRGSTKNIMDDVERSLDDAISVYKGFCTDTRLVPGAGATEMAIANGLKTYATQCPGLDQYAIAKFGEALEVVPRTLAENAGFSAPEVIAMMYSAQKEGKKEWGLDIAASEVALVNTKEKGILDSINTKYWALNLSANAATTVLRVDQIIMSKPAGGPKPPKQ